MIEKKKSKDPFYQEHIIKQVKDLTALNKIIPESYIKFEMEKHFSKDVLDLKYIPKLKKKWIDYKKKV